MKFSRYLITLIPNSILVLMLGSPLISTGAALAQNQPQAIVQTQTAQSTLQQTANQSASGAVANQATQTPVQQTAYRASQPDAVPFHNYWYFVLMALLSLMFIASSFVVYVRRNILPGGKDKQRLATSSVRSF